MSVFDALMQRQREAEARVRGLHEDELDYGPVPSPGNPYMSTRIAGLNERASDHTSGMGRQHERVTDGNLEARRATPPLPPRKLTDIPK